uniref:FLYWCH-type domain-containing protein n=1 Tax=Anopheles christyi TaxID=43041 RepID=A0A182JNK7_9DIPT
MQDRCTFIPATFGKTRRGQLKLLHDGHAYTRDRQSAKTCNWKCSLFTRYRCRARAVTKEIGGIIHMKVTNTSHYHPKEEYKIKIKKEPLKNKTFENGTRVNWKCRFYHRLHCKARAQTRLIDGIEYVKVFKNEHSHPQEAKSVRRRKQQFMSKATLANFSITQRGRPLLVQDGYSYIRNGEFSDTINWRCSMHRRHKCKAKAITMKQDGREYVRLSHPTHNHPPKIKFRRRRPMPSISEPPFEALELSDPLEDMMNLSEDVPMLDFFSTIEDMSGEGTIGNSGGSGSIDSMVFVSLSLKNKIVRKIYHNGFYYCRSKCINDTSYWVCDRSKQDNCRSRITTFDDKRTYKVTNPGLRPMTLLYVNEWLFTAGQRGKPKLVIENNSYFRTKGDSLRAYWSCSYYKSKKCRSKLVTHRGSYTVKYTHKAHTHPDEFSEMASVTPLDADIDEFYIKDEKDYGHGREKQFSKSLPKTEMQRIKSEASYRKLKQSSMTDHDDEEEKIGIEHKFALDLRLETGSKGRPKLIMGGYAFFRNNSSNNKTYWLCSKNRLMKCRARIITLDGCSGMILKNQVHNHPPTEQ